MKNLSEVWRTGRSATLISGDKSYHIVERPEDKSIVIFYVEDDDPAHYVIYDSLDSTNDINTERLDL